MSSSERGVEGGGVVHVVEFVEGSVSASIASESGEEVGLEWLGKVWSLGGLRGGG